MRHLLCLLACLLSIPLPLQAGELYRWVDSSGKVHYGDAPPPGTAQVESKRFLGADTAQTVLPYETRRAQQNFPVTLYATPSCGESCEKARSLLGKRGIPYTEVELLTDEEIGAFKAASGGDTVPTLAVGRTFLRGFLAAQWNSELDIAGYPKIAQHPAPVRVIPSSAASGVAPANPAVSPDAASEVAPANPVAP